MLIEKIAPPFFKSPGEVASGIDRHLDITFGLHVVDSSSLVSVLFREAFSHPYISFLHLLVNVFSVIKCGVRCEEKNIIMVAKVNSFRYLKVQLHLTIMK